MPALEAETTLVTLLQKKIGLRTILVDMDELGYVFQASDAKTLQQWLQRHEPESLVHITSTFGRASQRDFSRA